MVYLTYSKATLFVAFVNITFLRSRSTFTTANTYKKYKENFNFKSVYAELYNR